MEACEKFCDESVERWIEDLKWASDDAKVRSLLQDVIYRCKRFSVVQARFWKRVVELYWRSGWSTPEIANQFGVGKERVRAVVKRLRREAQRYFGQDGQVLQPPVQEGQESQPQTRNGKPKPPAIQPDATNQDPEYWETILESHGLADPDVQMRRLCTGGSIYKFAWRSSTSVHAEPCPTFFEGDTLSKKPRFQRLTKTTSPRKQIGTKTIEIDGRTYQVRIFEAGRPDGCFRFWANPRTKQAGPDREYDAEETKGILAHLPTIEDVEQAIDGNAEAREFLQQYDQIRDSKSSPLRDEWSNPPKIMAAPQSTPDLLAERQECVRCKRKRMTVLIDADKAIHQQCESKSCAYMAVWKPKPKNIKHDVVDLSGLRVVRDRFPENPMNNFMPNATPEGTQPNAP